MSRNLLRVCLLGFFLLLLLSIRLDIDIFLILINFILVDWWSLRVLVIFMNINYVVMLLYFNRWRNWLCLCGFRLVAHHRLVHLLWCHVIELIQIGLLLLFLGLFWLVLQLFGLLSSGLKSIFFNQITLLLSGLRVITHHGSVHLLWFHLIELIKILALFLFVLTLILLIQLNRNFFLRLIVLLRLLLLFLSVLLLETFLNWTLWMLSIFMQSDYILVLGHLSKSREIFSMLCRLGLVAHHGLAHLLWLHVVELVQVLAVFLLLSLWFLILTFLFLWLLHLWLLLLIVNLIFCLLWVMSMMLNFNKLSSIFLLLRWRQFIFILKICCDLFLYCCLLLIGAFWVLSILISFN